jgi:hypothetical protein
MTEIQVDRRHVRRCRIEVEFRIQTIARLEYEFLTRLDTGDWLDRVMNPVEAIGIIFAVFT